MYGYLMKTISVFDPFYCGRWAKTQQEVLCALSQSFLSLQMSIANTVTNKNSFRVHLVAYFLREVYLKFILRVS